MKAKLLGVALLLSGHLCAQTTLHLWRMGEDDGAASSGVPLLNAYATAAVGTNLPVVASRFNFAYDSNSPGAGSSLSVAFNSNDHFRIASNLGLSSNFGIEAWVYLSNDDPEQWVFLLGNDSIGQGMGIGVFGDEIGLVPGGDTFVNTTPSTINTWAHVAMVSVGTTARFYYNGSLITGTSEVPTVAASFSVGGNEGTGGRIYTGSLVDHVRVFSFDDGTFNTSMLTYPASAIPEPSTYAVAIGIAVLGFVAWRRRLR
jgi:hypothetical protein